MQKVLRTACKGTSVTIRELFMELTQQDLADIKNGDLLAADLRNLVMDMADSKDNVFLYRVNVRHNNVDPNSDGFF